MWGEAGVVTLKNKIHTKLQDKGTTCIFVGYAKHHAGDVYEMWNPTTLNVHTMCDATWLNRMFYHPVVSPTTGACIQQAGESDKVCEREEEKQNDNDEDDENVTLEIRNTIDAEPKN